MRLEHLLLQGNEIVIKFQFHKGAIRTSEEFMSVMGFVSFQFHKGTIRTCIRHFVNSLLSVYFNSIKVRLEQRLK